MEDRFGHLKGGMMYPLPMAYVALPKPNSLPPIAPGKLLAMSSCPRCSFLLRKAAGLVPFLFPSSAIFGSRGDSHLPEPTLESRGQPPISRLTALLKASTFRLAESPGGGTIYPQGIPQRSGRWARRTFRAGNSRQRRGLWGKTRKAGEKLGQLRRGG
jgi:hypothetical protein